MLDADTSGHHCTILKRITYDFGILGSEHVYQVWDMFYPKSVHVNLLPINDKKDILFCFVYQLNQPRYLWIYICITFDNNINYFHEF